MSSILVLHGPNLNLLGSREPAVYGSATLDDHVLAATDAAKVHGHTVAAFQSNSEGELVDAIHAARGSHAAIVVNAGAFTHYSWALHDALRSFEGPVVEVHLSNPGAREEFRHMSVLVGVVDGSISGFGGLGYRLAIDAAAAILAR